jgi:signal transduction histidine kinase
MTAPTALPAAHSAGVTVARRTASLHWRWEWPVAVVAVVSAGAAFWITLRAGFLEFPAWLGVQKADLILGPVFVGLYWRHRRPYNRLGILLIALGLLGIPYILESATAPGLFGVGVMWEEVIYPMTVVVILAFPSGRLDGVAERLILAGALLGVVLPVLIATLSDPHFTPSFSISGCHPACPRNGLALFAKPPWLPQLSNFRNYMSVAVPVAILGLYAWRWATARPPRRRALAIGAPIAVLFVVMQASYRMLFIVAPNGLSISAQPIQNWLQWTFAAARSLIWYGFLFALIAVELFAGRTLRRLVSDSLGRPSLDELEPMVREPLGDPGLRLGFWRPSASAWVGGGGDVLAPPGPGQTLSEVERDGRPAIAIVHDEQLSEDPELLQAAGAVALLALENAELDSAWKESLGELADSRSRLVRAGARERRKLERDLHDGAQQRLVAASIDLSLAGELTGANADLHERVSAASAEVEEALSELREVAHGIYPPALARWGLARAFEPLAARYHGKVTVLEADAGRFASEVEAAVYYCCLEAVQNAVKHAGPDARVSIRLYTDAERLHLEVRDDGPGFDPADAHDGIGLQNMRDRLGAAGGRVKVESCSGQGTLVAALAPLSHPSAATAPTNAHDVHSTLRETAGSVSSS